MFKKIMVCLDGSMLAEQILPYAKEEALQFKSKLILLHVSTIPTFMAPGVPGASGGPIHTKGEIEREQKDERLSQNYLEQMAKPLRSAGIKVDCMVLAGMPGESIVNYAETEGIELIAIATHGRSGVRRLIFGSVADFVLRNSHLPILLIKPTP